MLKNKEGQVENRGMLREPFKTKIEKARAPQVMKKRRTVQRKDRRVRETVERKIIHYTRIVRNWVILRECVGSGLMLNVEIASSLAMRRECARTNGTHKNKMLQHRQQKQI